MKTRQELIDAVKVKLEEISPYEEPASFIAAGDTAIDSVKPIISYIERTLDEAAHNCMRSLPLTLLHADIERKTTGMTVDVNGVGFVTGINATYRYIRFRHEALQRDITAFISSEDPLYLVQQNKYVHGGPCKPAAVLASFHDGTNAGQIEIYSFKDKAAKTFDPSSVSPNFVLLYINTEKRADDRTHKAYVVYRGINYYYVGTALEFEQWRSDNNNVIFTESISTGNSRSVYSAPNSSASTGERTTLYTPAFTDTMCVKSPISEYIVLECAAMVAEILGDVNTAQICRNQYQAKLQSIVQ